MSKELPGLDSLGLGRMGALKKLIPGKAEAKSLGYAMAGGAIGTAAAGMVDGVLGKIPGVNALPSWARQALVGLAIGHGLWSFGQQDMAKGAAGAVVGGTIASAVMGLVGGVSGLGFTVVPGAPGAEELAQSVSVDPDELAEIEPSQQFGGLDARVEEVPSIGSWIGA